MYIFSFQIILESWLLQILFWPGDRCGADLCTSQIQNQLGMGVTQVTEKQALFVKS